MTSDFQQQAPLSSSSFFRSQTQPQHGQKAAKDAAKVQERPAPTRKPAH
jgi:hypothetical protein